MFGLLLILSFCDFNFVMRHFKFLKTVTGKGVFNIFLASMFLVGNDGVWGWVMFIGFATIGIFFVLIGLACIEGYDDADIKKEDLKNAKNSFSKKNKNKDPSQVGAGDDDNLLDNA